MYSRTLPIGMAQSVAFASLAPARRVLLCGPGGYGLANYLIARAACERRQVRLICGDNRFDPYAVSRLAKARGVRPEAALRSVLIARAFTAYQLSELVARLDPSMTDLVVISGPCSTFFDEDVSIVDAARLFYRMLWRTVELAGAGMTLLMVQGGAQVEARRAYFLKDLCRASDVVLRLTSEHSFSLENRRKVALPYLAALDRITGE
jgi:hypothetical protein